MARPNNLARMSIDALVGFCNDINTALSKRATDLRSQLSALGGAEVIQGAMRGRKPTLNRGSALKGRKVAAKYRSRKDPKLTWAGRGATPRWMRQEMKAGKLKKEAFLIK